MKARQTFTVAAAITLVLLSAACKINKDTNCLNPKAACYNKDTEAPRVESTTPPSNPSVALPPDVQSLSSITIVFTEPMKNADQLASYPSATGTGGTWVPQSVTKVGDRTYTLVVQGTPATGTASFNLGQITDLSGNATTPSSINFTVNTTTAQPDTVTSSSGYTETNITWKNSTPDFMNYIVKKNGTDCASASAVAGTNVSGTVTSGTPMVTNLAYTQITSNATDTIRICLTPVTTGTATSYTVSVSRDDNTDPVTNNLVITNSRCQVPYSINLTCTDRVDRIIYTLDGSTPSFTQVLSGGIGVTIASTVVNLGTTTFIYSLASGFTLNTRGSTTFTYACVDKAGRTSGVKSAICASKFVWDESNWAPVAPNDVWD